MSSSGEERGLAKLFGNPRILGFVDFSDGVVFLNTGLTVLCPCALGLGWELLPSLSIQDQCSSDSQWQP